MAATKSIVWMLETSPYCDFFAVNSMGGLSGCSRAIQQSIQKTPYWQHLYYKIARANQERYQT
jgi:hypothetical protein